MTAIDISGRMSSTSERNEHHSIRAFLSSLRINGLRVVLVLAGANTIFAGLSRAFGGIATLGWQGSAQFLSVVVEHDYLIQDNHNRFLGGVWAAIGLMLIIAPLDLKRFLPVLNFIFALIFVGGLARFTAMRWDVVFGPDIIVSLIAELVGMPVLFFWLSRTLKSSAA